jgi:hypothetical protein
MSASESVEYGLIDEVLTSRADPEEKTKKWIFQLYSRVWSNIIELATGLTLDIGKTNEWRQVE